MLVATLPIPADGIVLWELGIIDYWRQSRDARGEWLIHKSAEAYSMIERDG